MCFCGKKLDIKFSRFLNFDILFKIYICSIISRFSRYLLLYELTSFSLFPFPFVGRYSTYVRTYTYVSLSPDLPSINFNQFEQKLASKYYYRSTAYLIFRTSSTNRGFHHACVCLLYTSPSPRDRQKSRMPSSA